MTISRAGAGVATVALSGLALLGLQSSASAAGGCPNGQHYAPGTQKCVPNHVDLTPNPGPKKSAYCPGGTVTFDAFAYKPSSTATGAIVKGKKSFGSTGTYPVNNNNHVLGSFQIPSTLQYGKVYFFRVTGTNPNGKTVSYKHYFKVPSQQVCNGGSQTKAVTKAAATTTVDTNATSAVELGALAGAGLLLLGAGPAVALRSRRRR